MTTAAELIAELQKLPPDAEVVTSIRGWEGHDLGPVTIGTIEVVDHHGSYVRPPSDYDRQDGRTVYLLDSPA